MGNNQPQFTNKQKLTFGLILLVIFLYYFYPTQNLLMVSFSIYYFSMLILWWKEIVQKWKETSRLHKEIKERLFFNLTELRYETDVIKRRKVGEVVLFSAYGLFLAVGIFFYLFNKVGINLYKIGFLGNGLAYIIFGLVFIAIVMHIRYYWISVYYYVIPILSLSFLNVTLEEIGKTESIIRYFCFVVVLYVILTLLLPVPYLRKVTSSTLIFGALFSIIVPIFMEHILSNYVMEQFSQNIVKMQEIYNYLPKDFLNFLNEHGLVNEINEIIELIFVTIFRSELKVFSTINFLWLSGYVIGSIIINIKLKLGEMRATAIYDKLLSDQEVEYSDLRDAVYFGGDTFKHRVVDNVVYRKIIYDTESEKEFLKIKHNCFVTLLMNVWNWCIAKLQMCIN